MSNTRLGVRLTLDDVERDAVHVALVRVYSNMSVYPGQHVGLVEGSQECVSPSVDKHIGIVDPFLSGAIEPVTWFYMCLYPNTVTGMRHHWEHPSFTNVVVTMNVTGSHVAESVRWLTDFAKRARTDYRTLIDAAASRVGQSNGLDFVSQGFVTEDCVYEEHDEMWKHLCIVLGCERPSHSSIFSCAC